MQREVDYSEAIVTKYLEQIVVANRSLFIAFAGENLHAGS